MLVVKATKPYLNHDSYAYLGFMFTDPEEKGVNSKLSKHWRIV
jgi:hypothetical protein